MKTSIPSLRITFALVSFVLVQNTQAVSPPPDGFYPGFNTAEGQDALFSLTAGSANTAVGWFSLKSNAEGSFNTATGAGTLLFNTADANTAFGTAALLFNTTGSSNTAVGAAALLNNTEGDNNTAAGFQALFSNTTGLSNTANGVSALFSNTIGEDNTATGISALGGNTTGANNTANGAGALFINTTGDSNTAIGSQALFSNTTGDSNTANGDSALINNTTGIGNIALGASAGSTITTGSNNIHIGHVGDAPDSDTIRIGQTQTRTFIGGIFGQTTAGAAIPVLIDAASQLGTVSSSRRFKKQIQPMDKASVAILALKPVTFHYKSDTKDTPQFGLIAEEVAEVNPDLVVRDDNGEIYTVRYDAVNAMLLNEFLKEHRKNEEQEARIAQLRGDLQSRLAEQQKQIEALTEGLQKISAQLAAASPSRGGLELNKFAKGRICRGGPAPQTVCLPAVALREGGNNQ
jgi:hypothetical protein